MSTKFSDFIKEIKEEAVLEGPEAVEQICLLEKFFANERSKPMRRRVNHCMISCRCKRCNPGTL
jgi:hypothetical protein